jgi:hypothetical protein
MMRRSEQINGYWDLARESSADGGRLRRRIAALGALSLLVCGFLLVIGLGVLVLAFLAGIVGSVGVLAAIAAWPRLRQTGSDWLTRVARHGRRVPALVAPHFRRLRGSVTEASAAAGGRSSRLVRTAITVGSRVGDALTQKARATATRFAPGPARVEPHREALRLNTAGAQHRRDGRYEVAVECHRQALEILRALDDRRAVALTQSNLALALSHSGDDEWAIGLFEEAAATLRELGDEEHEAQIMANLGLAHRRHGRREEGDNVLELALAKLNPTSTAYHAIEAQLQRAS